MHPLSASVLVLNMRKIANTETTKIEANVLKTEKIK